MASTASSPQTLPIVTYCILPMIAVTLVAAIRPNVLFRAATVVGWAAVTIAATQHTLGDSLANYSAGSWFGTNCFLVWWLLFYLNPVADIRYVNDKIPIADMPLWKRSWWILSFWFSPRAIGWNVQINYLPPSPGPSRARFLMRSLWQLAFHILLVDIAQTYKRVNPLFRLIGDDALSLGAQRYLLRCANILAYMAVSYGMLNIQYYVMGIVGVASGFWEPTQWPDAFGPWSDAYTIRRFWGRVWHQMMRRVASSTGKTVARVLKCPPGSWSSSRIQLLVGFSASGLTHVVGDAMVGRQWTGCSFIFFFVQPFAITLEDTIISQAKKAGIREARWTHCIGYVWTFAWFSLTTPWFVDWALRAGVGQTDVIPFSIVDKLLEYLGVELSPTALGI